MVTITDKAKSKIDNLIQDSGLDASYFLRVSVQGGGCSGLSYKLDFDNEEKVNAVRNVYEKLNIRTFTQEKINDYFARGINSLEQLEISDERKKPLLQFVRQLVEREK